MRIGWLITLLALVACQPTRPVSLTNRTSRAAAALTSSGPFVEIRAATPRHLVAVIQTPPTNETGSGTTPDAIDLTPAQWTVNGQPAVHVYRSSDPWDEGAGPDNRWPVTVRHSIYLELPSPLQPGNVYAVHTPYGDKSLTFDERATFCEAIRVNQVGYHANDTTRFAVLGVSLGNGGSYAWTTPPPYSVVDETANRVVASGTAAFIKDDTAVATGVGSSGQQVYHLSLAQTPPGGPYYVSIPSCGRSRSFGIGDPYMRKVAYVATRGLYHQRCGTALTKPYTEYTRGVCHTMVADTKIPIDGQFNPTSGNYGIHVPAGTPTRPMAGGHHDAGDFQIRAQNVFLPELLLEVLEAWPSHFIDKQYNIPESGNGIPDLLDEVLWSIKFYENLQITDRNDPQFGGVQSGTMDDHDVIYGSASAASSPQVVGTLQVTDWVTLNVAGVFAQVSRLLRPYDATHADALLQRAKDAWAYGIKGTPVTTISAPLMYAALELYEATGEAQYHTVFRALSQPIVVVGTAWPNVYLPGNTDAACQTAHFLSYLLPNAPRPADATLAAALKAKIVGFATNGGYMGPFDENSPYSQVVTKFFGWGAVTTQFRYTEVNAAATLFITDPTQKQKQFNLVAMSLNYALGENPQGLSFVTGLGTDQPNSPAHDDSYYTKYGLSDGVTSDHLGKPIGNVPGILLFGASDGFSGQLYQQAITGKMFPPGDQRPVLTRYAQGWTALMLNEFATWNTNAWLVAHIGFLYDASKDPGAVVQPVPPPNNSDAGVPAQDAGSVGTDASVPLTCVVPPVPVCGAIAPRPAN